MTEEGHPRHCKPLFEAGKALLVKSGLVGWDDQAFEFAPKYPDQSDEAFEAYWKKEFHCEFGRYMAWVLFGVGWENLLKAACVCNDVGPKCPNETLGQYEEKYLGQLQLCGENIPNATVTYLRCIRNRDAHHYRPNVRRQNFPGVGQFVEAFNCVVGTMKARHHTPLAMF